MPTQHLTSDGKEALRKTIRGLRADLIEQLKEAAEREYRLGTTQEKARLPEEKAKRRARLEAWADEQSRADWPQGKSERKKPGDKQLAALRERYLLQGVKEAAHTLINRLVILRILEHAGHSKPAVVTGGWKSAGYREFAEYAAALCSDPKDDSKGYGALLQLLFDELSLELPGVFGNVGLTRLFPVPAPTLRCAVEALNDPALDSAWADDTTLGWVYQFYNDPEREALDEKINGGGKIEPHEIAPKTQMFTERYMVEWLLQNSLGQTWLAMCKKHGWTPDFEQVRAGLEARRAAWREQRKAGKVAADALLPTESPLEERWKYWVPQPMPEDAPKTAPNTLRELKLLDPACGSGHFLVIAFDLLTALYEEEARHQGEQRTREQIARFIVEDNLHGIDIDPRAIQIAAAAVWLKAKLFAPKVRLSRMNLVAPTFKLGALSEADPALVRLQQKLERDVGLPRSLTRGIVSALDGVDHLGSLLRVDSSIRQSLQEYERDNFGLDKPAAQTTLFADEPKKRIQLSLGQAMSSVMTQLGRFLDAHEGESDLGLRLEGEQLAAGVRFLQLAQEGRYDLVVGNPPYQGTSKMAEAGWFKKHYPRSKADLYACFLERGLELVKPGGQSALITMRGWMFLSTFEALRKEFTTKRQIAALGDVGWGAFRDMKDNPVTMSVIVNTKTATSSVALAPTGTTERSRTIENYRNIVNGLLAQVGRFEFDVAKLQGIEGTPLVYWWNETFLDEYIKAPKLGDVAPIRVGLQTSNDSRFLRSPHEPRPGLAFSRTSPWVPFVKGAAGKSWIEPVEHIIRWARHGLDVKTFAQAKYGSYTRTIKNEDRYLSTGVAFSMIGADFAARAFAFPSVFGHKGSSAFPSHDLVAEVVCILNCSLCRFVLSSLNPGIGTEVGDVVRAPDWRIAGAPRIYSMVTGAFSLHESHREPSVEFKSPGPSPWRYAQDWAQRAVDRAKGEPLPPYEPEFDPPEPTAFVSFAIGVALGRFGQNGEGILDLTLPTTTAPPAEGRDTQAGRQQRVLPRAGAKPKSNGKLVHSDAGTKDATGAARTDGDAAFDTAAFDTAANDDSANDTTADFAVPDIAPSPLPAGQELLPDGILFVCAAPNVKDSLDHAAAQRIEAAWHTHGSAILEGKKGTLREWLCKDFFAVHKSLYENRPIYFPLSSESRSFVAWVSIHRWANNTLQALLANHLHPVLQKLQGEISDLNAARASSDKSQRSNAEKQYAKTQKLLEELEQFIADVTQCAEKGAPPTDGKCTPREVDAPFVMDLDDGVMINSAALWPLLTPQWKDPKKWWKELCTAQGRKDYDWAHVSARYFRTRVDEKCKLDPSLGVAHGSFWKYHPAKAYAWELRLQDEIAPDFTIDEVGSDEARAAFIAEHAGEAEEIRAKEMQRRERNRRKAEKGADGDDDGSSAEGGNEDDENEPALSLE